MGRILAPKPGGGPSHGRVPRRPGQGEREALLAAGRRLDAELARLGLTEEELLADFKRWRKIRRSK